jgi:hypothetical protein
MWFISCWSGILPAFCGDIGRAGKLLGASFILGCWVFLSAQLFPVIALLLLLDGPLPTATSNLHLLLFCFVSEQLSGIFGKLARGLELLIPSTSGIGYLLFHCLNILFILRSFFFGLSILVCTISAD